MSTVLNSAITPAVAGELQAPSARQMTPLLAANFAVMAANYAFVAVVGALARQLGLQAWHLGLVIAVVGLLWVLCAAPWGRLAGRVGHAGALRRALGGVVLAFALLAAYVQWALAQPALPAVALSLAVLLVVRGAAGAFTAGVPVAAIAWMAGRTAPRARAAVMARYGAAGALGMVLAPPAAGWLGGIGGLPVTLLLSAALPLLPLALLGRLKAGDAAPVGANRPPLAPGLHPLDARIRLPWFSSFALYSVVIIANVCIGFYLIDRLGAAPADASAMVGSALGAAGLALMLSQALVSRRPQVAPMAWLRGGALLGALGFGSVLLLGAGQPWLVAASFFVAGSGMGLAFPAVAALAANGVRAEEQPACAAAMAKAQGASMIAAPLLGAGLYELLPAAPFLLMLLLLVAVFAGALRRREV